MIKYTEDYYEYDGKVLTVVNHQFVDVKLYLTADIGFDTQAYFGSVRKRLPILEMINVWTSDVQAEAIKRGLAISTLNRDLRIRTYKGLAGPGSYACSLFTEDLNLGVTVLDRALHPVIINNTTAWNLK